MKNKIVQFVIVAIVAGGVSFYGGMKYGQSASVFSRSGLGNMSASGRLAQGAQFVENNAGGRGFAGRAISGEILVTGDQNITIKLADGGSKIILLTEATPVMKMASGTVADLVAGEQILVTGTANQDGSVSAQSIQIRNTGASGPPSAVR